MGLTLLQAPDDEPISVGEARRHLRVDISDDDALILALIVAARQQAESLTGRALISQKWRLTMDTFPAGAIELPNPQLLSVQEVSYLDTEGVRQTLASSAYQVVTDTVVGSVQPAWDTEWPAVRETHGSVRIDYTAGYGVDGEAVPQGIKQWMLLAIGTWYSEREAVAEGSARVLPREFWAALLDPYRIYRVA